MVLQDQESSELPWEESSSSVRSLPLSSSGTNRQAFSMDDPPVCPRPAVPQTKFSASVSIKTLLNAGKLVQPRKKTVLENLISNQAHGKMQ